MQYAYLATILFSLLGMGVLDWRYRLALFHDTLRAVMTVGIGVLVFIVWDIFGISLGIFFSGHSPYMSGMYLGPEFPVEELLFLTFLCYFTLVMYRFGETKWRRI